MTLLFVLYQLKEYIDDTEDFINIQLVCNMKLITTKYFNFYSSRMTILGSFDFPKTEKKHFKINRLFKVKMMRFGELRSVTIIKKIVEVYSTSFNLMMRFSWFLLLFFKSKLSLWKHTSKHPCGPLLYVILSDM